jgi:phospholipid/cholesterol/gamma-HCH transport system substrate-binding protein
MKFMRLQRAQVTWSQLRVGIFTSICLAIILWFLFYGENGLRAIRNQFTVETIIDSASGVKPGTPVRLAGIEVGEAKKVEFIHQEGLHKVRIQMALSKNAAEHLRSDSIVQVKSAGLTDNRVIEISLGTSEGALVADGDTLSSIAPMEATVVLNQIMALSNSMDSFLSRFESLVNQLQVGDGTFAQLLKDGKIYQSLNQATQGVSHLMSNLNAGQGILPQLLSDGQLAENITQSAASTAVWGKQVTNGEGTLGKLSTDAALFNQALTLATKGDRVLENLETRLEAAIALTEVLVQKISDGDGTAAKFVNTPELYNQIHATAERMEQFMEIAQSGEGTVGQFMSDAMFAEQVSATTASLATLTQKLNTPGNTFDTLATGSDLVDSLLATTVHLESILTKVNNGEGSLGKLTDDQQTAESLSQLIANLRTLIADIHANPKKYVKLSLF